MARFSRTSIALAVLATVFLSGCGSQQESSENSQPVSHIKTATLAQVQSILPTQQQVLEKKQLPYFLAGYSVDTLNIDSVKTSPQRVPASLAEKSSGSTDNSYAVNNKCAVFEQVAMGLFSTPQGNWKINSLYHRSIILGQSGIDEMHGYVAVAGTESTDNATKLLNDFKSNSADCSQALKKLYPSVADSFVLQSPSVDASTGVATIQGKFNGQTFIVTLAQREQYLISTWLVSSGASSQDLMVSAADTIEKLALQNADGL